MDSIKKRKNRVSYTPSGSEIIDLVESSEDEIPSTKRTKQTKSNEDQRVRIIPMYHIKI